MSVCKRKDFTDVDSFGSEECSLTDEDETEEITRTAPKNEYYNFIKPQTPAESTTAPTTARPKTGISPLRTFKPYKKVVIKEDFTPKNQRPKTGFKMNRK